MTTTAPDVITRYLKAADEQDFQALADCFTPAGTVLDEGHTYSGREEIIGWREALIGKYTYTSTVTGSEMVTGDEHRVTVRVEGDFPGGVADLTYTFILAGGLIAALKIIG
jgi:hypothetical protein